MIMEDNTQNPNPAGAQSGREGDAQPSATQQPGQELLDELTQLADKFASVVKSAWNSEQRKQVENDVRSGLNTMAASLEDGFKQVASSRRTIFATRQRALFPRHAVRDAGLPLKILKWSMYHW
jgi:hypothetical protein